MLMVNARVCLCWVVSVICIYTMHGIHGNSCNADFCNWKPFGRGPIGSCVNICEIHSAVMYNNMSGWLMRYCSVTKCLRSRHSNPVWYRIADITKWRLWLNHDMHYHINWDWENVCYRTLDYHLGCYIYYISGDMSYTTWMTNNYKLFEIRLHQDNRTCGSITFGDCCEHTLPACDVSTADVIFVLDSSISQTKQQFEKQLRFVGDFIEEIKIGPGNIQIGLVTYSTSATAEIWPRDNYTKTQLKNKLRTIKFRPGATYTNKGLDMALHMHSKTPRKPGMELETYVIVLTDGMSTNPQATVSSANRLKAYGVHVIAIGVGNEVSHKELHAIASPTDIYSSLYVFSVESFEALNSLLKNLVSATCPNCAQKNNSDIILFFDNDASIVNVHEFEMAISIATYIVEGISGLGKPSYPRVGIEMLSNPTKSLPLDNGLSKANLLSHLQTLPLNDQCADITTCRNNANNTLLLLNDTVTNKFHSTFGGRRESRKFILLFTTGRYAIIEDLKFSGVSHNVTLIVIGLGADVNMSGLLSLATEPSNVYVTTDPKQLSHLDGLHGKFSYVECKANH